MQSTAAATETVPDLLVRRIIAVVGLAGIALIHLLDLPSKMDETPYLGWAFIGLIVASLVVAEALIRGDDPRAWLAAGVLAAATIAGYVVSRAWGLPGQPEDDLGNWQEPLGMASLLVEAIVVWLAVSRLTTRSGIGQTVDG